MYNSYEKITNCEVVETGFHYFYSNFISILYKL